MNFLIENWQTIVSMIGASIVFIFRRPLAKWTLRQNKANVESTQASTDGKTIDNLEKAMNLYVSMIEDIERRYEEKLKQRDEEIIKLKNEVERLKNKLNTHINK